MDDHKATKAVALILSAAFFLGLLLFRDLAAALGTAFAVAIVFIAIDTFWKR
jgi:hypothetical protein